MMKKLQKRHFGTGLKARALSSVGLAALSLVTLLSVSSAEAATAGKTVSIYNWSDYIDPTVATDFTKETGIKVNYDTFDQNETLEAKLQAGKTGYDIAVPTLSLFGERGIKTGLYLKLDKTKLKNYGNIDKEVLGFMSQSDPGNDYALPWVSAVNVVGYNAQKIKEVMPDAPVTSAKMIFDPVVLAKFKSCGVMFLDSATDVIPMTLMYLGLNPNSENPDDYKKAGEHLAKLRPSIRKFDSSGYINALAAGDVCLVLGFSTDIAVANRRAKEAGKKFDLVGMVPTEGSQAYVDAIMIPKDSKNVDAAYQFIDYILRPDVSAKTANYIGAKTANSAAVSKGLVDKKFTNDISLFPSADTYKRLYALKSVSPATERLRTRLWTRVKSGH
ncbi:MAG: extracellular solute-binding protein [Candidatus Pacebacteria bacterium]|nr:extracellular solute-binding protein [Candidatus Paceibacterota bacterium]